MSKLKEIEISTLEDVQAYYNKKFKKAGLADQFKLKCWLAYCQSNEVVTFEGYLATQNQHKFLDKLALELVDFSDIGAAEDIAAAIEESYNI